MALTTGLSPSPPQETEEQDGPLSVCTDDMDSTLAPFRMYPSPPAIQTRLQSLPSELLQLIVAYLDTRTLKDVALVSHTLNQHATDKLWQNVCLADQWKLHLNEKTDQVWGDRGHGESDEHDDTPIIQKLYILATNPTIASKVHVVTHRCHLPTPNIFNELPRMSFDAENLSQDARIHVLVKLALRNLVNVHTLRIVYGHWKLTNTLVAGFLDESRPRRVPLRKLWLESCCFDTGTLYWFLPSQTTGLESIRLRRLGNASFDLIPRQRLNFMEFKLARGGHYIQMHNGVGSFVGTTVQVAPDGLPPRYARPSIGELVDRGKALDAAIWEELWEIREYIDANPVNLDPRISEAPPLDSRPLTEWIIACSTSTLTSLNLDWIHWRKKWNSHYESANSSLFLTSLSKLRFPQLRAFQIRNAVMPLTRLPDGIYLLEDTFLGFLEAHLKIQCLGWPMDKVYSHVKPSVDVQNRSRKLVAHLATMLTDLRVDAQYMSSGEPLTDDCATTREVQERTRRHRFIAEFVPHMRKLEQIKIEGGIPRDEKRELLRALHWCSLKKIVMIGVSFPVGNTWGAGAQQLKEVDPGQSASDFVYNLEEEDGAGILAAYRRGFPMLSDFQFEPDYGWPPQAPLLQTIALHHASTVEELKICGCNGCPILSYPNPITNPLLAGLRSFDNLKQLVLSFWLLTWYEDSYRDTEIIQSWLDVRSPSSTALTVVTPPASPAHDQAVDPGQYPTFANPRVRPRPQEFNRWAVALKTKFSPSALAYRVARDIGPFLSPLAKERKGGVRVRGSFCLGVKDERRVANDIFDLDIRIGSGDQVLEFVGPREEGETGRWWTKLEQRRWF
ncbi:F-box multi-domain protein [Pyrenophora tritici-repentis]|uniref:F-box domain containing protein n=1 Tax=Pyrenophora tritici-repentis TaxID=45151 RepID=A0A922SW29_9PLEO|nr:F-box domain containing protein [Pyrenophora tritici-repentis]KAI1667396.1 F-box multi-domain protein [Pyrenophora tritici-repentis]KAI1679595.1 F-box [Pyrenophora tritici-repentis]